VLLDVECRQVTVPDGMLLDLGATAKALAADRAAARIEAETGCGVLINLGGDISVGGLPPGGGWLVGVADDATFDTTTASVRQHQVVVLKDGGLATSSVLGRAWQRGGARLHHIIAPRTGMPAQSCLRTVTVAAASCVDANIASTAAILRGERAADWLERLHLPSRLVWHDGSVVRAHRAHHAQCLVAAEIGQPEVEQDQVGRRVENVPRRRHRARRRSHRVPVLGENPDQRAADRRVVLYQQKLRHGTEGIPFGHVQMAYGRFT